MDMEEYITEFKEVLCNVHKGTFKRLKPHLENAGLTFPQFLILELVDDSGLMMKEIAERMHISLPAVTGFIDKLSNLDYVERIADPNDRRVSIIKMTSKGKVALDQIQNERAKSMKSVFSNFSEDELKQYMFLMHKLESVITN